MKKILNKKGMTLVEIILSIGLVSIVMVQVLNLLVDLKDEQVLGQDKTADLTNRAIIIKTVQDDFMSKTITKIEKCNYNPSTDKIADYTIKSCIKISYADEIDKPGFLIAARDRFDKNDYFIYGYGNASTSKLPVSNSYEAWKLTSGKYPKVISPSCGFILEYFSLTSPTPTSSESNYVRINYPVKVKEAISNTSMTFDLEFLYYYRPNATIPTGVVDIDTNLTSCSVVKY